MRILLCETNPGMTEIISVILRGDEVTAVDDPSKMPPLAAFDVLVTNCDIFDAVIPTLFISATSARCKRAAAGGLAVLPKPFTSEELQEAVRSVAKKHA